MISTIANPEQMLALGFDLLSDVTAGDCLELIRHGKLLSTETIANFQCINIDGLSEYLEYNKAIEKLSELRADIACVIINHPNGAVWLKSNIELIRKELLENVKA